MTRLLRRLRHFRRNDDGQVIVIVVVGMLLFLAIAAVVVDGGHAFVVKRSLQNAVDAASLAAAGDTLPADGSLTCEAGNSGDLRCDPLRQKAEEYLGYNGFPGVTLVPCIRQSSPTEDGLVPAGEDGCYMTPYGGTRVLVRLSKEVPLFFGSAVGFDPFTISARAAATVTPVTSTVTVAGTTVDGTTVAGTTVPGTTTPDTSIPGTTSQGSVIFGTTNAGTTIVGTTVPGTTVYTTSTSTTTGHGEKALFALNTTCSSKTGIVITGNNAKIDGDAISNGSVTIGGNPQTHVKNAIYKSPGASCKGFTDSKVDTQSTHSDVLGYPQVYDGPSICSQPGATVSSGALNLTAGGTPDGIYCSDTSITVSGNASSKMNVTLIAPQIHILAGNVEFHPFAGPELLFYVTCGNAGVPACVADTNTNPACGLSGGGWPTVTFCFAPNNQDLTGVIFVPNGTLVYGGNSGPAGFYEAQNIIVTGNSFTMVGTGGTTTTPSTTTVAVTTLPGTTNPGSSTPGTTTPDTTIPGTTNGGTTTPGTTIVGTTDPGSITPGTTVAGTTQTNTTGTNIGLGE